MPGDTTDYERDNGFLKIKEYLPWIQHPLIVNAPMGEFTSPELIASVIKAGGHGQHGTINLPDKLPFDLDNIKRVIDNDPELAKLSQQIDGQMPIGLGFLCVYGNLDKLKAVVAQYKPAVIWLFAAITIDDYKLWAKEMRDASPGSKIWIQSGSVAAISRIAAVVRPDAIVVQGSDAGGHGFENGAGVVALLPEVIDTLAAHGYGDIPVLASGGISDGRGVAAVLSLGAAGAVMGTRFLVTPEAVVHPIVREKIIAATDGGQTTIRTKMFDDLMGGNWPGEYDSRGLRIKSMKSGDTGADIEAIKEWHSEIARQGDGTYADNSAGNEAVIWAGCGVGLCNRHQSAQALTEEVRDGARRALHASLSKCQYHEGEQK